MQQDKKNSREILPAYIFVFIRLIVFHFIFYHIMHRRDNIMKIHLERFTLFLQMAWKIVWTEGTGNNPLINIFKTCRDNYLAIFTINILYDKYTDT